MPERGAKLPSNLFALPVTRAKIEGTTRNVRASTHKFGGTTKRLESSLRRKARSTLADLVTFVAASQPTPTGSLTALPPLHSSQ